MKSLRILNHGIGYRVRGVCRRTEVLNEVWSGILDRRQAVELPDGHYLLEVTGVEGLKRQSFELRSEAKSIAIATEQSSGRSRGADFADGIAEERGGVVGKVSGLEMKSPSTPTIRHSL